MGHCCSVLPHVQILCIHGHAAVCIDTHVAHRSRGAGGRGCCTLTCVLRWVMCTVLMLSWQADTRWCYELCVVQHCMLHLAGDCMPTWPCRLPTAVAAATSHSSSQRSMSCHVYLHHARFCLLHIAFNSVFLICMHGTYCVQTGDTAVVVHSDSLFILPVLFALDCCSGGWLPQLEQVPCPPCQILAVHLALHSCCSWHHIRTV